MLKNIAYTDGITDFEKLRIQRFRHLSMGLYPFWISAFSVYSALFTGHDGLIMNHLFLKLTLKRVIAVVQFTGRIIGCDIVDAVDNADVKLVSRSEKFKFT